MGLIGRGFAKEEEPFCRSLFLDYYVVEVSIVKGIEW